MKTVGIFLDDERNPEDVKWVEYPAGIEWYVVRRMNDFLFCIYNMGGAAYVVSFDHDLQDYNLNGKENTGYDCLKSLVGFCMDTNTPLPQCFFHTMNPVGKKNMESYYQNAVAFMESQA